MKRRKIRIEEGNSLKGGFKKIPGLLHCWKITKGALSKEREKSTTKKTPLSDREKKIPLEEVGREKDQPLERGENTVGRIPNQKGFTIQPKKRKILRNRGKKNESKKSQFSTIIQGRQPWGKEHFGRARVNRTSHQVKPERVHDVCAQGAANVKGEPTREGALQKNNPIREKILEGLWAFRKEKKKRKNNALSKGGTAIDVRGATRWKPNGGEGSLSCGKVTIIPSPRGVLECPVKERGSHWGGESESLQKKKTPPIRGGAQTNESAKKVRYGPLS